MLEDAEARFRAEGGGSALGGVLFQLALELVGATRRGRGRDLFTFTRALGMGYACRLGQPSPPRPEGAVREVESRLVRGANGEVDYDAMSPEGNLRPLFDLMRSLATLDRLLELCGESKDAWITFTLAAAVPLCDARASHSRRRRAQAPSVPLIGQLIGVGYAIGFIDEIIRTPTVG
jgi:hypothetical protein